MRTDGYTPFAQTRKPGFAPGYDLVGVIEALGCAPTTTWPKWQHSPSTTYGYGMLTLSITNFYWRVQRQRFQANFEEVMVRAVRQGRLDPAVRLLWRLKINEMLVMRRGIMGNLEILADQGA
jgi:hypothetical protein